MDHNVEEKLRSLGGKNILFIGLGNEYMGDDAAGMILAKKISKNANVLEAGNDLMGAIHSLSQKDISHAIFLDAAGMGLDPGETRILEEDEVSGRCISTHENNFPLAMHYMRYLNPNIQVIFLGIQFSTLEMQETPTLSPEVAKAVDQLSKMILSTLGKN